MKAIGYVRVSTEGQASSGLSLDAQKAAIAAEAQRRGWELSDLASDVLSAKQGKHRPGLERALERLDSGAYGALVVARLDRLARSVGDFASIIDRAGKHGWVLVMIDPPVDLTTAYGKLLAQVAAAFAEFERELISQRTKEGIAAKVAAGGHHGRPKVPDDVERIIVGHRKRGLTLDQVCAALEAEGVPTVMGGPWYRETVRQVLKRNGH